MGAGETPAVIAASGFREYDLRWQYPDQINTAGMRLVGRALGTQLADTGAAPRIVVGHDFRRYSPDLHAALSAGLVEAGAQVHDIGMALSPMAYFARGHLGVDAVAMLTASHNPNGWTGVKIGFTPPLTHGPDDIAELRRIVDNGAGRPRPGGRVVPVPGLRQAYIDSLCAGPKLSRPLRVVVATGNGTASAFAPQVLRGIGAEVVELHCTLDDSFPHYNPNPEAVEMLADMGRAVRAAGADLGLGLDGDGDRLGVVDERGREVWSDRLGLLLARALAPAHPGARLVVDIKSTGLFARDPVLREHGVEVEYWKTGHSHIKRRIHETGALAGFEKSGHFYFAGPLGGGYDCALSAAVMVCRRLQAAGGARLSQLAAAAGRAFTSPTVSPGCADDRKYQIVDRLCVALEQMHRDAVPFAGQRIVSLNRINGVRVQLSDGSWFLIRASSNTPNLVVVAESLKSKARMQVLFASVDNFLRREPGIGACDQLP